MSSNLGNPELARVIFARRNVQPPTTLYVSRDDYLTVTCLFSDLAQDPPFFLVRLLTPLGAVQHMTYRMTRAIASSGFEKLRFPLREGQLLGVEVRAAAGGAKRGDLFAIVELTHSLGPIDQEHAILCADYVTIFQPIGWPQGMVRSTEEGPGHERMFSLAAPAAGQDPTPAVPSGCRWMLKSIQAPVTTSAVAGTRQVRIAATDGLITVPLVYAQVTLAASAAHTYAFVQGPAAHGPSATFVIVQVPLPPGLWIRANFSLVLQLLGRQAGDAWQASNWWVEEAISG